MSVKKSTSLGQSGTEGAEFTDRTRRRTSYYTSGNDDDDDDDDDIDDMGWSKKKRNYHRAYSSWKDQDVDADGQQWAEEEDESTEMEQGMFDDLDEFMNEGWFDAEMKV